MNAVRARRSALTESIMTRAKAKERAKEDRKQDSKERRVRGPWGKKETCWRERGGQPCTSKEADLNPNPKGMIFLALVGSTVAYSSLLLVVRRSSRCSGKSSMEAGLSCEKKRRAGKEDAVQWALFIWVIALECEPRVRGA